MQRLPGGHGVLDTVCAGMNTYWTSFPDLSLLLPTYACLPLFPVCVRHTRFPNIQTPKHPANSLPNPTLSSSCLVLINSVSCSYYYFSKCPHPTLSPLPKPYLEIIFLELDSTCSMFPRYGPAKIIWGRSYFPEMATALFLIQRDLFQCDIYAPPLALRGAV